MQSCSRNNMCNKYISKYTGVYCPSSRLFSQTDLSQKLSLCSKLCFAIGGAPKEVAASATAFFLQIYLLDVAQVKCVGSDLRGWMTCWYGILRLLRAERPCCVLQINAFQASMVLFIGKVWGAVTDPVVGFFITKSRWTRIGRLMPWWAPFSHVFIQCTSVFLILWDFFFKFKKWQLILKHLYIKISIMTVFSVETCGDPV